MPDPEVSLPTIPEAAADFTAALASFTAAQTSARAQLFAIDAEMDAKKAARRGIENAAPHTDDIVAAFLSGVRTTAANFERGFEAHLKAEFKAASGAAAVGRSPFLLDANTVEIDREAVRTRRMRGDPPSINIAALAFFMRDEMEAKIPALVDRLFPAARTGMKAADRREALRVVDAELEALKAKHSEVAAQLDAARAAVMSGR